MTLDDTLRWAETFPMHLVWAEEYETPESGVHPNWRWLHLWDQENPHPGKKGFDAWYAEHRKMADRIWVAAALPQFQVFDWPDEDVANARRLVSRHVCGVCGRSDDSGCVVNC